MVYNIYFLFQHLIYITLVIKQFGNALLYDVVNLLFTVNTHADTLHLINYSFYCNLMDAN